LPDESPFEVEAWLADWIAALPGFGNVASGVFPIYVPSSRALPAITYRRQSTKRTGSNQGPDRLATGFFEVRAWALSDKAGYKQATAIARLIRVGIDGFRGHQNDHHIRRTVLENEFDDDTPAVFNEEGREVYALQRVLQVSLVYSEIIGNLVGN